MKDAQRDQTRNKKAFEPQEIAKSREFLRLNFRLESDPRQTESLIQHPPDFAEESLFSPYITQVVRSQKKFQLDLRVWGDNKGIFKLSKDRVICAFSKGFYYFAMDNYKCAYYKIEIGQILKVLELQFEFKSNLLLFLFQKWNRDRFVRSVRLFNLKRFTSEAIQCLQNLVIMDVLVFKNQLSVLFRKR